MTFGESFVINFDYLYGRIEILLKQIDDIVAKGVIGIQEK